MNVPSKISLYVSNIVLSWKRFEIHLYRSVCDVREQLSIACFEDCTVFTVVHQPKLSDPMVALFTPRKAVVLMSLLPL